DLNPAIPAWLADLISTLHAKDPADRFQSADEVARLLRNYLRHLRAPGAYSPPRLRRRAPGRSRKWWLLLVPALLAVVALPVLLCAGIAYWLVSMLPVDAPLAKQGDGPPALQQLAA